MGEPFNVPCHCGIHPVPRGYRDTGCLVCGTCLKGHTAKGDISTGPITNSDRGYLVLCVPASNRPLSLFAPTTTPAKLLAHGLSTTKKQRQTGHSPPTMSKNLKLGVNNLLDASAQGKMTNIGPLTTSFAPAPDCDYKCFGPSTTALVDTLCSIYSSDCSSIRRSCVPDGSGSWVPGGFYSPGMICPNGWTTATTIEYDPSNLENSLLEPATLISDGETADLCCPQGLDLQLQENTGIAPVVKGAYCVTTLLNSQLSYWTCKATNQPSGSPTKAEIGTSWWQTTNMRATRTTTVSRVVLDHPA